MDDSIVGPRAAQLSLLIDLLCLLTLPDGVLADGRTGVPSASASAATPTSAAAGLTTRSGRRSHLLHLAPSLIECIGQPARLLGTGPVPAAFVQLQVSIRKSVSAKVRPSVRPSVNLSVSPPVSQ